MEKKIGFAPTLVYPESDGKPMAETGRHVRSLLDMIDMIDWHFRDTPDVHVSGNMFLYYEEGNPRKSISPDVFMVRGLSKKDLRVYKTWEQPATLDFVLELASPSTFERDFTVKKDIYAEILRVKEYYIYDPYHEIEPSFIGFRLIGEAYQEIAFNEGRLPSEVLGMELGEHEGMLRLYDPVTSVWLAPSRERVDIAEERVNAAEERVAEESHARQEAESLAERESRARQEAEAELAKARAALKRLGASE